MDIPIWLLLILALLAIIGLSCIGAAVFLIICAINIARDDRKLHKAKKQAEDELYRGLQDSLLSHLVGMK